MRSKTSSFNPGAAADSPAVSPAVRRKPSGATQPAGLFSTTLFRKNLSRLWPLWALYAIVWTIILPLTQFSALHGGNAEGIDTTRVLYGLESVFVYGGIWMTLIWGALAAMVLFSFLSTARSVGFMHTLPIRREGLFLTNYLSGLFLFFSTHVVVILLTVLVDMKVLQAGGFAANEYWKIIGIGFLVMTLLSLFFFSFAVFCAMFTGQILTIPVFYGILNMLTIGLDFLVRTFAGLSLYGISGSRGYSNWALWFSPAVYLVGKLRVVGVWDDTYQTFLRYDMTGFSSIFIYGAAGLVLAAFALVVYRVRRSETAGDTVTVGWARQLFKYGVAGCAALSLGQGFYAITWGQYLHAANHSLPGELTCMLLMGLIGYYTAEMLLKKSFRIFKSSWKGAAALAACLLIFGVGTDLDVFGVESRLPASAQIQSVEYQISGQNYLSGVTADPALTEKLLAIHGAVIAEKESQQTRAEEYSSADPSYSTVYLTLTYNLQNGGVLSRQYNLYYTAGELADPTAAIGLLNAFCSEPAVEKTNIFGTDAVKTLTGGEYSYTTGPNAVGGMETLGTAEAQAVYQAVIQDIVAGRFDNNLAVRETYETRAFQNRLTLYFVIEGADGQQQSNTRDIPLNTGCTATIAKLEELGIVSEEAPLLTYSEFNALYGELPGYADKEKYTVAQTAPVMETTVPEG